MADFGVGEFLALYGGTIAETAGAVGSAVGVAGQLGAFGRPKALLPPAPLQSQTQQDESAQQVDELARRRQSIAGGITSTLGTAGGSEGAVLNPANLGQKTLLGA